MGLNCTMARLKATFARARGEGKKRSGQKLEGGCRTINVSNWSVSGRDHTLSGTLRSQKHRECHCHFFLLAFLPFSSVPYSPDVIVIKVVQRPRSKWQHETTPACLTMRHLFKQSAKLCLGAPRQGLAKIKAKLRVTKYKREQEATNVEPSCTLSSHCVNMTLIA